MTSRTPPCRPPVHCKLLTSRGADEARHRPSADLSIEPEDVTQPPPQPSFEPVIESEVPAPYPAAPTGTPAPFAERVCPPTSQDCCACSHAPVCSGPPGSSITLNRERAIAAFPDQAVQSRQPSQARNGKPLDKAGDHQRRPVGPRRARPFLVAALLVVLFSMMLLATHKYVTSHWNPFVGLPLLADIFIIGREGVTTTDVNLRPDASSCQGAHWLAEAGSRVKILATGDNWYEIQILEHGRPKTDPFTADRGWINKNSCGSTDLVFVLRSLSLVL